MAQKPRKSAVRDMIKNLLESEIPEIQDVAKQLADRIKQLEEHGWKLQHYATQLESLAEEEAQPAPEVSLMEIVKDLEKTLDELRQRPGGIAVGETTEEKAEESVEEKAEQVTGGEGEEREVSEAPPATIAVETYTTPEGFVVRKLRR